MAADVCAQLAEFSDAHVLLTDSRGKLIAQSSGAFRLRESVDGLYIDSKISDSLLGIGSLTIIEKLGDKFASFLSSEGSLCRYGLVLPLYCAHERIATLTSCSSTTFDAADAALLEAIAAILVLILGFTVSSEASAKRRDAQAVKHALGTLSYSELAAVLHVFREIGSEGLTVAAHIADKLKIARSVVVTALRKLEGAGLIETRSLGVKGTYIKAQSDAFLEELYKIRD
jgi:transcriptional pleiotropic repressor